MRLTTRLTAATALLGATLFAQTPGGQWLDGPLTTWNDPGSTLPQAVIAREPVADLFSRCRLAPVPATPGARALQAAGWVPFHVFDRELIQGDVEILGGMAAADGMCRPLAFNVFVFAGGRLAGTLSPRLMDSRTDGVVGAVRLSPDETMAAEFSRYENADALCCPSSRVTVRYRLDRTGRVPVVVPTSLQQTR